jgi:endonuclease/exonuclease/phosphatase family metal-dependent hydrolase
VELARFTVATYNVWFDPFEQARRCQAVLAILERERPDVIALEEVTPTFLACLLEQPWVRAAYRSSRAALDPGQGYDVVMLSRQPVLRFQAHALPTDMGRRLHTLVIATSAGELAVAGVHLESMRERTPTRVAQIHETIRILGQADAAVWVGDFNASPASDEDAHLRSAFRDAWDELSSAPGYTRDTSANAMLAKVKADRHQRIDRVLLRGPGLTAQSIRLLGTEPLPDSAGQVFPSDHFGVIAELAQRPASQRRLRRPAQRELAPRVGRGTR